MLEQQAGNPRLVKGWLCIEIFTSTNMLRRSESDARAEHRPVAIGFLSL